MSFILADKSDKGVPCAAVQPCLLCGTSQGTCSIQLLPVCMCRVLQCQEVCVCHSRPLEERRVHHRFKMEFTMDAAAAQTTRTGSCWHEKGAQSMQVRACMRMLSPPNDSAMCSLACQRGFLWLTGYPTLVVTFF